MAQWHIPPDHIVNHWSEPLLMLMFDKMADRLTREADAYKNTGSGPATTKPVQITARDLRKMGQK